MRKNKRIPFIGDLARINVGIETWANEFFTVSERIVETFHLQEYARPLVGRGVQVRSLIFTHEDWKSNQDIKVKSNILIFPKMVEMKENEQALEYLRMGECQNIHKWYKCGIREEWQIVPSVKLSDALFVRRTHIYPKFIKNDIWAYTTDTMHRVSFKDKTNWQALIASFYNSLSFAFCEIVGRGYWGWVLELMPSEVEEILIPYKEEHAEMIHKLDQMFREKKNIDEILAYSDEIVLKKGFGFSDEEIQLANRIWKKLSRRRLERSNSYI